MDAGVLARNRMVGTREGRALVRVTWALPRLAGDCTPPAPGVCAPTGSHIETFHGYMRELV
jgi:hypothetical protein